MTYGIVPLALALVSVTTRPAHHGTTGHYDRTRPRYLSGTVLEAEWEYPHARLVIDVPAGVRVPADVSRFAEIDEVNDRKIVRRLAAQPPGRTEILLPPDIMGDAIPSDDRPERGDRTEAVVFPRCDQGSQWDGELRVQALTLTSGRLLFRGAASPTRYADGCPGERRATSSPQAGGARGTPSERAPGGRSAPAGGDDGGGVPIGLVAGGLGVTAAAAVAWIIRRRRRVSGW